LRKRRIFPAVVLLLASGGAMAQQARPVFSANGAAERIENLDTLKAELQQYHKCTCKCGCYAKDLDAQADRAIGFLRERAARRKASEKLVLILDIDETTLSNYPEMVEAGFGYQEAAFDAWVQSAKAPVIPGTLRLYKEAQRLNVKVIFISGRAEAERGATERNLRAEGIDHWERLYLRPAQWTGTIGVFKAKTRRQLVADGYTLALNVGDQWSDLKSASEAEFNVKYPDPFYLVP